MEIEIKSAVSFCGEEIIRLAKIIRYPILATIIRKNSDQVMSTAVLNSEQMIEIINSFDADISQEAPLFLELSNK